MAQSGPGAPLGNTNGTKNKPWADALKRALARYASAQVEQGQALNAIADNVVVAALDGDKDAINEIANRLDGKPKQTIDGPGEDGAHVFRRIEVQLVRAAGERD